MAGAERGAGDLERGAVGVEAAAGAKIDFFEDASGTFPFGLAVCFKFEGRGRGNGGASGRIECVPKTIADGCGDVLKSPSFGLLRVRRSRLAVHGPASHHEAAVQSSPSRVAVH